MLEVYGAVREAVGDGFPVTARLSVEDSVPGGLQREESIQRARTLAGEASTVSRPRTV